MHDDASSETTTIAPGPSKTSLSRGWVIKSVLIILVCFGLAVWGYVDATIIYVKRGQNHVDAARLSYLDTAINSNMRRADRISVPDPAARLAEIKEQTSLSEIDKALFEWLNALDKIENLGALAAENEAELAARTAGAEASDTTTMFADPVKHRRELKAARANASQPKPLNTFDIPSQWLFVVVGLGAGVPLLLMFLVNASKSYRYDPASRTVTLPDGTTVTPGTLTGFDKRKWDKFLVFITIEGESEERKIDLYRYTPLEKWLVDVYEHSAIYEAEPEPEEDAEPEEDPADAVREGGDGDG